MRVQDAAQPVADWIWEGEDYLPELGREKTIESVDLAKLTGQFAIHQELTQGDHYLVRDRLGVNKLFFAIDEDGQVHTSNFLIELRRSGFPLCAIHSVPSGHSIRLCPAENRYQLAPHAALRFETGDLDPKRGLRDHASAIGGALERVFARLAIVLRGRRVFLTLSGGLDSTTIAALAARHLDDVTAVTFELESEQGPVPEDSGSDLASARLVAEFLDIPHEVIRVSPARLFDLLDPVLVWGQDWRDFNVHCGLVNAALASGLRKRGYGSEDRERRPVFLTGDTMNELMADYHAESYGGQEHYALPRIGGLARRRKSLVEGLDTGDREIGVFSHYGFDTIQPYALCAEAYTAIPAESLASDQIKQQLVREIMGESIPAHVYERPKVRAQVGSSKGVAGTLAALIDRGINSEKLASRFADLFGGEPQDLQSLIRAGFYRMSANLPQSSPRNS